MHLYTLDCEITSSRHVNVHRGGKRHDSTLRLEVLEQDSWDWLWLCRVDE